MKKYFIVLSAITSTLIVAALCLLKFGSEAFHLPILAAIPLYFMAVNGFLHYSVVTSLQKDMRTFDKNFLAFTVGSLFLHLIVLFVWSITHIASAKIFMLGFCVCYVVYLVTETVALVLLVQAKRKEYQSQQ